MLCERLGAFACCDVSSLDHKPGNDSVESRALESERASRLAYRKAVRTRTADVEPAPDPTKHHPVCSAAGGAGRAAQAPVQSCLKFSAVNGTALPNKPMVMRPADLPSMATSK